MTDPVARAQEKIEELRRSGEIGRGRRPRGPLGAHPRRNRAIVDAIEAGEEPATVARRHGLTRQRIDQIVRRYRERSR